jgi:hypothetical protein
MDSRQPTLFDALPPVEAPQAPRSWRLVLPAPTKWLDANRRARLHHQARGREVKAWRTLAWAKAREAKLPTGLARVHITATLWFAQNRHRDRENYYDAVKPVIDGLTVPRRAGQLGYGLIHDDTPEHLAPVVLELKIGRPEGATSYGLLVLDIVEDGDTR